jgi:nicotine blue oxidoreductase
LTVQRRVAGILLAAGEGSRLGRPKALVEIGGQRLADRGVALLRAGGADPIVVVTGAAPVEPAGAVVVHNPGWRTGMGSSLAAALRSPAVAPATAAVIALADQPLVGPEAVRRLITAHDRGASVAVASYGGRPRNPVLIAREHWDEVVAMATGDAGARPFLRAHPELVTLVECGDTGRPDDIDTPEDLARVAQAATSNPFGPGGPVSNEVTPAPTPRYSRVVAAAADIARGMHHPYVGVEHLFLAIIHDRDAVPTQALAGVADLEEAEARLLELMNSAGYTTPVRKVHGQPGGSG